MNLIDSNNTLNDDLLTQIKNYRKLTNVANAIWWPSLVASISGFGLGLYSMSQIDSLYDNPEDDIFESLRIVGLVALYTGLAGLITSSNIVREPQELIEMFNERQKETRP